MTRSTDRRRAPVEAASSSPTHSSVRIQLSRIAASPLFEHSGALIRFLEWMVEGTLRGDAPYLKEYSAGVEVFGRGEGFDQRVDPIVRVQARKLRTRLTKYYAGEGVRDPIVIELPKGRYVPVFSNRSETREAALELTQVAPEISGVRSIAVLPLLDLSRNKDQEYFSDGLTDELITVLSKIEGLRLPARMSVFHLKGRTADVREIGKQLDVTEILEGTVRVESGRARVSLELVDARNGFQLWSEVYDFTLEDVFSVQEQIASAVARALPLRSGTFAFPSIKRQTLDPEVYVLYLKGRYFLNKRTEVGIRKGIECFESLIEREPTYAPAYAGLAVCHTLMGLYGAAPGTVLLKSNFAASKATAIDPLLPEAHLSLALSSALYEWNWSAAEWQFDRAIELDPYNADSLASKAAYLLTPTGRQKEAIETMERAVQLEPLSLAAGIGLGSVLYFLRDYKAAAERYQRVLELDSGYIRADGFLARTLRHLGETKESIRLLRRYRQREPGTQIAWTELAQSYVADGDRRSALDTLDGLYKLDKFVPAAEVAKVFAGLGDIDRGLECLEQASATRDCGLVYLKVDPGFDPLRGHPRFHALLERLHLS